MKVFLLSISLFLSLNFFGQKKIQPVTKKSLKGQWVSIDDKKYTIQISDTAIVEFYEKEKTAEFTYTLNNRKIIKTDKSDGSVYQYKVLHLTSVRLSIIYLDRGNLVRFVRKK